MQTDSRAQGSERLLRDFDKTAELVQSFVADRYGEEGNNVLYRGARKKYEEIIPQIPRIEGARAKALNGFLRITAQEVAVYKAVQERGGTAAEAWEVCHEAIRLRMNGFPKWKRWLLRRFMYSGVVRRIVRRREEKNEQPRFGDFEIRYLTGDGTAFDFGVDYVRCGNLELAKKLGAEEFAPLRMHVRHRAERRSWLGPHQNADLGGWLQPLRFPVPERLRNPDQLEDPPMCRRRLKELNDGLSRAEPGSLR